MFTKRDYNKISFHGVGLLLIFVGAIIVAVALASWMVLLFGGISVCADPIFKAMGGFIILGLGYLILEIELLRKK